MFHYRREALKIMTLAFLKNCYLFLAVLSLLCLEGFSLVVASGGYSPVVVRGLLIRWLLLLHSAGSREHGLP